MRVERLARALLLATTLECMSACGSGGDGAPKPAPVASHEEPLPSPAPPSPDPSVLEAPAPREPSAAEPSPVAPASPAPTAPTTVRGRDRLTNARAEAGTIRARFHVHDPCDATLPRVAIDLAARSITISHADRPMRCGAGELQYVTTIEGLPEGVFAFSAPGLARTEIRVPAPAAQVSPRARTVDVTPPRASREEIDF